MENMKIFVSVILLGLSLLTALLLESQMGAQYITELVLILIGIIITAGILFGLWIEEPWAYTLATIVFAAGLINLIWIYSATKNTLMFSFGILVNVAGLVMCLASVRQSVSDLALETYPLHAGKRRKRK